MTPRWDGSLNADGLAGEFVALRERLDRAAGRHHWPTVLHILRSRNELINAVQLGDNLLMAPLHVAAQGGAPEEVVAELLHLGAWRMLRNAQGARAADIAARHGHQHLAEILKPVSKRHVPIDLLLTIQARFHAMIHGRVPWLLRQAKQRLPELEPLLKLDAQTIWFPVPGMYGGFAYRLATEGDDAMLISESWSRIVGGSDQVHEITASGCTLTEEGTC